MKPAITLINGVICIALAALLFSVPNSPYTQLYIADLALSSLLAISFDVTFGFGGMLNLAQALFFGAASYVTAWLLMDSGLDLAVVIPIAMLTAVALAALVGFIAIRGDAHGLLILTLIFVTVGYVWAQDNRALTGGDDGIVLAGAPWRLFGESLSSAGRFKLSICLCLGCFVFTLYIMNSPFGRVLRAIKDNELRCRFVGYETNLIKILSFCMSGIVAGVAGIIYAVMYQHVHTGELHWIVSANALIWAFFGGLGTLCGPVLGVLIIRPFEDALASSVGHPKLFTGLILIAMVLINRGGVLGLVMDLFKTARFRWSKRWIP